MAKRRWRAGAVGLVLGLVAALLAVQGRARPAVAAGGWWHEAWAARVAITVGANGHARRDKPVDLPFDGAAVLAAAGVAGTFDPASLRVLEVDGSGTAIGAPLAAQYAAGRLTFVLPGDLPANASRTVHVYLDTTAAGHAAQPVAPQVSLGEGDDAGQPTYVVTNQVGQWHVQKANGSLSSAVDVAGNDWIGFDPTPESRAGGEFRGMPNFPSPEGHFHPGFSQATTEVVAAGPLKVTLRATSLDGKWSYDTDWFPSYATSTVTKADPAHPGWWWLYEGTPGGALADDQVVVRPTPGGLVATSMAEAWSEDLSPEEWAFFGAPAILRSLYVAHHEDDGLVDSYRKQADGTGTMTVFGFGRAHLDGLLSAVPQHFTFGLMNTVAPDAGAETVRGAYKDLAVTVGQPEARGTATTTTTPQTDEGYGFVAVPPARILDTRFDGAGPLREGEQRHLQVHGRAGVPADAMAVVANVTVTETTTDGYLALHPTGAGAPGTSNLNWWPGQTVPNLATVAIGGDGRITAFNAKGTAHVVIDVVGYHPGTGGGGYHPVAPLRLADTRLGGGKLGPGGSLDVQVTGVPQGVRAVALNVTAANGTAPTFLTVYPTGPSRPHASNLNPQPGETVPNAVVTGVDAQGRFTVFNAEGHVDVIVDLLGWYDDGSAGLAAEGLRFHPMAPVRVADTRATVGAMAAGSTFSPVVAGAAGVPLAAKAVAVNVTVAEATGSSFLTVYPAGVARPHASLQNLVAGTTRANLALVGLGEGGRLTAYNAEASTQVIFDVAGWFG